MRCSARRSICENFQYSPSETLKKRPRACQPHRRSPVHRLRARHAAAAPHSHLSKVYSHLKTAEWRPARRPSARRARAERACPSQLPLALPAARGPQGRCVGHCCCATPLVLVDTRASRAAFAAVPKRCSARRDTARWSGIRAAMPLSLRESTRATSRTRHAIGRQRRSRRCRSRRRAAKCLLSRDTEERVARERVARLRPEFQPPPCGGVARWAMQ